MIRATPPTLDRRALLRAGLGLGAGLAAAPLLAACGGGAGEPAGGDGAVRYAYVSLTGVYLPVFAAIEQNYFADAGVTFEPSVTRGSAASVQQILGGAIDCAGTAIDTVAVAINGGADVVGVSGLLNAPWSLIAVPGVTSFEDLRGGSIGVTQVGSSLEVLLREMMRANGIEDGEYEVVGLGGTTERVAALNSGAIAAGLLTQPQDFELVGSGMGSLGYADEYLDMQFVANFVERGWAEANPDTVTGMLTAQTRGAQWLADPANRDASIALLSQYTNAGPEAAAATYDLYVEKDLFATALEPRFDSVDALLSAADMGENRGAAGYFDTSYLESVSA
ncbi:ABC transporter substrate-binding protein [Pseudonocardia nematodicida]|uniref:ABC transporter substrate-binding protein n=1 Tax=Pseudonocardia nematodicida TaxID=1206997 RepID=A0ABV1K7Y8_9PSEU